MLGRRGKKEKEKEKEKVKEKEGMHVLKCKSCFFGHKENPQLNLLRI